MRESITATADTLFPAAEELAFYFIGVSTGASSIMRVFPAWARHLGISESAVEARLHRARKRLRQELAALEVIEVPS